MPVAFATVMLTWIALAAPTPQWGNVSGQVVWDGKERPKVVKLGPGAIPPPCLKNGPVEVADYAIHVQNDGVRWVMVYLAADNGKGEADYKAKLPVHKDLQLV